MVPTLDLLTATCSGTSWPCWKGWSLYMDETCCPIVSTCRTYFACTNDATKVDPIGGVLSSVGIFNAAATADSPTNAYIMAVLSNFAYPSSVGGTTQADFDTHFRAAVLPRLGGTAMTSIWGPYDLEAIVVETYNAIIVVWAGSESMTDWVNNMYSAVSSTSTTDFSSTPVSIASGFYDGYIGSRDVILALVSVKLQAAPTKELWFAGHSLGGAYATLFAARAKATGLPVAGVYTFGQPAVGDQAFANVYNGMGLASRTYRYAVSGDPVPGLPPGFVHVVPTTVTLGGCARRLLSEQADSLAPHEVARLEAEVAAEAEALAADAGGDAVASNRRMLGTLVGALVPHGILDNYAYYIHTCRLSPTDRSTNVPLLTSVYNFAN
ncbi:hypothetical protein HYH03_012984 [Edaphochlamys debaryana]|uniref:Fungal lipase-type domain-containing protein n=1 Tax=Edaphochlamys debaryana TaxID=47281 RepID=A0A835XZI4_9CHLO|nr:hypothetical protein HYH03_012984 [Edaphochlamys debaryana]|eukprot:KAG2488479.1 hypothetical protein HYH03_012984 [Edaphochlamys debaryana]